MPTYVIVDVTITNPEEYEAYKLLTPASITAHGGRFIVRGDYRRHLAYIDVNRINEYNELSLGISFFLF